MSIKRNALIGGAALAPIMAYTGISNKLALKEKLKEEYPLSEMMADSLKYNLQGALAGGAAAGGLTAALSKSGPSNKTALGIIGAAFGGFGMNHLNEIDVNKLRKKIEEKTSK